MTNAEILENIKKLCRREGITVTALEKELEWGRGSIGKIKNAKKKPTIDRLQIIADRFNVPVSQISGINYSASQDNDRFPVYIPENLRESTSEGKNDDSGKNIVNLFTGNAGLRISKKIPVLGRVAAGIPITATENIVDWEEISGEMALDGEYFALQIKGDSMEPRICNGDIVIVRQQPDADSGDTVIALINGDDAVCKKLKKYEDGSIALISNNPAYTPLFFSVSDAENVPVSILGKVAELRGKL